MANSTSPKPLTNSEWEELFDSIQETPSNRDVIRKLINADFKQDDKMQSWPVKIERVIFKHKSGTKFYRVTKLIAPNGNLLVFQYGKEGSTGQIKVNRYTDDGETSKAFEAKLTERLKKGYFVDPSKDPIEIQVNDFEAMSKNLGVASISKIGGDNLKFLLPGQSGLDNLPEYKGARLDDEGRIDAQASAERQAKVIESARLAKIAIKEKEEQERTAHYAENETFGMF